ncbi:MAG TPA: hypothetical protein VKQ32_05915 [Polyangia bacterium]|nr:hypothetical protein [Polyangia bacterium]
MKFRSVILASALFAWGCGSSGSGTPGTGGTGPGSGGASGTTGSGGSSGPGGTSGVAGTSGGTSGTTGTGGSAAGTGATAGTGAGGTGGTGGSAAGTSGGGTTGAGGSTAGRGGAGGTGTAGRGGNSAGGSGGSAGTSAGGTTGTGGTGGAASGATVNLGAVHQTIQGFGINDNWASQFSSTVANSLFTATGSGIGLTILRTGMNPSGAFYNTGEATGNIAMVKSLAGSNAKIIGSVWSPPASCKTNNSIMDGGHLMTSCYDSWSTTIANFAGSNGFYAMSIGNEPDFASCGTADPCNGNYDTTLFTAAEFVAWVKMAGPKLQAKNVKVIAPEASEWLHTWSNVSAGPDVGGKESSDPLKCGCFPDKSTACATTCTNGMGYDYGHWLAKDTAAWAAFDILGVHEYDSQVAMPWPSDVNNGKPNKEIWQTEMSGVKWWPEQGTGTGASLTGSTTIDNGVAVAGWIHSALVDGEASAWLYWWYQASNTDDNEGLITKSGSDTKRHYTFGNYSKFVRPGFQRVEVAGAPSGVLISAFKGTGTALAIVAINKNASAVNVPITISGGTAPTSVTPWTTSASANLTSGTAVAVSGGSFTAALAATTVTTFVSQ